MSESAKPREPQVAVAPLNTIDAKDVGRDAAEFDAWLQSISGGTVTPVCQHSLPRVCLIGCTAKTTTSSSSRSSTAMTPSGTVAQAFDGALLEQASGGGRLV